MPEQLQQQPAVAVGPPRRSHGLPQRWRGLLLGAYLLLAAAVAADLLTGPGTTVSPVLAAVPVLAGTGSRSARVPLLAGLIALVAVALLSLANRDVPASVHAAALIAVAAVTLASVANVVLLRARDRELRQVRTVSEAAQRALLRPVPARIGPLSLAVRYEAAAAEARIGGDLYQVLDTPHGVRILLGDVQGKGLGAVDTAADVLGAFREAARTEADLAVVAERLDSALARGSTSDRFVTAVLVGLPGRSGVAEVVNCGHPAPMLRVRRTGAVSEVQPPGFAPPLGLRELTGEHYLVREVELHPGDLLLLYTDGVSEARDAGGVFYPLATRLATLPAHDPGGLLDQLLADVEAYVVGGLTDDAALLAVRREV
ncbi:serine phosphatase RsbU (regulator of sigma subunit) [Kitasatospora sp. MAP12-15]|uniref:PP2C family protein-serine/threonine phosphatase n=1 Tax=unclassified Kitasatospora TaxID=2633591 RepID=UPI002476A9F6|nr:PP2C family protein-serine/threonine phosphatase [Kitasatospora sp. MAP12-44]MDH6114895.1 serine phosphatase RsbU (regulator of sigma subunit) [Kitasatospora sp. MAP12-44]